MRIHVVYIKKVLSRFFTQIPLINFSEAPFNLSRKAVVGPIGSILTSISSNEPSLIFLNNAAVFVRGPTFPCLPVVFLTQFPSTRTSSSLQGATQVSSSPMTSPRSQSRKTHSPSIRTSSLMHSCWKTHSPLTRTSSPLHCLRFLFFIFPSLDNWTTSSKKPFSLHITQTLSPLVMPPPVALEWISSAFLLAHSTLLALPSSPLVPMQPWIDLTSSPQTLLIFCRSN